MFLHKENSPEIDIRAFYDSVFPILHKIAYRITGSAEAAEDIVHDSFMRFVEREIPFNTPDDAKFWLIRVVKNSALNAAKRKLREIKAYERFLKESRSYTESAESSTLKSETVSEIKNYLEMLPEKFRSVLMLKEYGDLSYREIGKVLGITEGNVKIRVFRAREALLSVMNGSKKE